jgi:hypothetical protein
MLYLHQIHELAPETQAAFESFVRDDWLPVVNSHDGSRFAWYGTATSVARFADEAITIVAFDDASAFDRFATAERESAASISLRDRRTSVQTRLLKPIDYDPWTAADTKIPDGPQEGEAVAYMHDFVPPVTGQMRGYIDMMRERYMALSSQELSGIVLRTSWQTVSGGGRMPEMFNLSEIRDVDALVALIAHEIPREYKEMGTWMWEALAARDQWTTRLARSATWSPVK